METSKEIHYCVYCHQEAKYQFKNGKWCCSPNMNGCPEIKRQRKEKTKNVWIKLKENNIKINFKLKVFKLYYKYKIE